MNYLLTPQNSVLRWIDAVMLFISGITSISFYFIINFYFCIGEICEKLNVSKIWVILSFLYLVYGISLIVVSIYIYKKKDLIKLYSLAITLMAASSFVLIGMQIFAIYKELNVIT